MKIITSLVIGVFVVLAMAIPAEAQMNPAEVAASILYGSRQPVYGGRYGYNDPRMDPRMMDPCFEAQQYFEGIRGTFHFDKVDGGTEKHFHACDPTQSPIKTREAGAYGGLGGGVIGGAIRGKTGAMIGATIGATTVGYLASRKGHDDCLVVEFIPKAGRAPATSSAQPNGGAPVSYQGQPTPQPVTAMEVSPEQKIFRNRFEEAEVRFYDGSKKIVELRPGDEITKEIDPNAKIWAEAKLSNPLNGKKEWTPLQIGSGVDKLPADAGWLAGNPETRPRL